MRLSDLNPEIDGTQGAIRVLVHDCPVCRTHKVRTPISEQPYHEESYSPKAFWGNGTERKRKIWQASGEFPETLTLSPSIDLVEIDPNTGAKVRTLCWHGFIANGEVT